MLEAPFGAAPSEGSTFVRLYTIPRPNAKYSSEETVCFGDRFNGRWAGGGGGGGVYIIKRCGLQLLFL